MNNLNSTKNEKACKSYDLQAFSPFWICFSGVAESRTRVQTRKQRAFYTLIFWL